jgi:hypothetical protein
MFLLELNYSPFVPHFVLERRSLKTKRKRKSLKTISKKQWSFWSSKTLTILNLLTSYPSWKK